ncbi:hypothetical protein [Variovorax sp. WS11]|uniref:hypothetical protein n=1 Tax=Variovorax sp. WS11 TaxID=1105204 RepID=UPI001EF2F8B6|nr:hypothetical protein [Variovorax sp. WS11]
MSKLLVPFNFDQLGDPREYRPPAERVIEGDVVCRNWDIDSAKDGKVRAGVFAFQLLGRDQLAHARER